MGWMVVLILVQVVFAALGLRAMWRRVFPGAARDGDASCVVATVWGPLAIAVPLIVVAGRLGPSVRGLGWAPLGAPACVGLAALGMGLMTTAAGTVSPRRGLPAALAGAGLVFVLLGGADELTIWTGQIAFAVAAVLLWMNTPSAPGAAAVSAYGSAASASSGGEGLVGAPPASTGALLIALACAVGQAVTGVLLSGVWLGLSVTIALAYAFAVVAGAARRGGSTVGLRTGGWTAAIGTFLGIGAISVVHLLPQSLGVVLGLRNIVEPRVAYGFGAYALEGMILFLLPAGMLVLPRLDSARRRRVGLAILLLAAGLAIWRITGIFEEVARR